MEEYKDDDKYSNDKDRIGSATVTENGKCPELPVETDPILVILEPENLWEKLQEADSSGNGENILDVLKHMRNVWSVKRPRIKFFVESGCMEKLLQFSAQDTFADVQAAALSLIIMLIQDKDFLYAFIENEEALSLFCSLLSVENEISFNYDVQVMEIIFDNKDGREKINALGLVNGMLEICDRAAENIEDPESIATFEAFTKIISKILVNQSEFSAETIKTIATIFVKCYSHPFTHLIYMTYPLVRSIFDRFTHPWEILVETGFLDIFCQIIPSLNRSDQGIMLQILLYLTAQDDEDGQALILERINTQTILGFLISFDRSTCLTDETFKTAGKVLSNMMRYDAHAVNAVMKESSVDFLNFVFDEGTADVKRIFGFAILHLLCASQKEDAMALFTTDLVIKAFKSLETAKRDELYEFLIGIAGCFCKIFGPGCNYSFCGEKYKTFYDDVSEFLDDVIEQNGDNEKILLVAESLELDYFSSDE